MRPSLSTAITASPMLASVVTQRRSLFSSARPDFSKLSAITSMRRRVKTASPVPTPRPRRMQIVATNRQSRCAICDHAHRGDALRRSEIRRSGRGSHPLHCFPGQIGAQVGVRSSRAAQGDHLLGVVLPMMKIARAVLVEPGLLRRVIRNQEVQLLVFGIDHLRGFLIRLEKHFVACDQKSRVRRFPYRPLA
jgi:hypothetical protein